jgi:NADPH:quinone reductase-like Zn-dependent oxidoreductase
MLAVEIAAPGTLRVADRAEPAGEVVVRAHAIGVNFADLWSARGEPGHVPGIEVAGVVEATGERVVALPWHAHGAYAELVAVPATHVFPLPDGIDFELAAAVPLNYLTAFVALERVAQVRAGEQVLVHAAAGGVGLAAVQLAAAAGAHVIATASPAKHEFLAAQPGVRAVVDYTRPDWDDEVRRLSGGGVDVALDGIGEGGFLKTLRTLGFGGRLAAFGLTGAFGDPEPPDIERMTIPFGELFEHTWSVAGVSPDTTSEQLAEWLADLYARCLSGDLAPRIDARFPLAEAADAHRYLLERRNIGKVLLTPD